MGKDTYLLRCKNFTPEMIEFMENQSSIQRTLTRLIEDAISRFGTGDLFQSTTIQLFSKNEKVVPEQNSEQLAIQLAKLLETTTNQLDVSADNDKEQSIPEQKKNSSNKQRLTSKSKKEDSVESNNVSSKAIPETKKVYPEEQPDSDYLKKEDAEADMTLDIKDTFSEEVDDEEIILELENEDPNDVTANFDPSIWDD